MFHSLCQCIDPYSVCVCVPRSVTEKVRGVGEAFPSCPLNYAGLAFECFVCFCILVSHSIAH